jgi:WD40 repeat protein
VWHPAFSPDGRLIATASDDRTARVFDASRGDELPRLDHGATVSRVVFSNDGRRLATASSDGSARLWNIDPDLLIA